MEIAFFDFDGTITNRDTFVRFVFYAVSIPKLILGLLLLSPILILFKLKLVSNHTAKEAALRMFFAGWDEQKFKNVANSFAEKTLPRFIKKSALDRIEWHRSQGHTLVLVSASIDYWLKPWTEKQEMDLICTKMDVKDCKMTGYISGKNCWGPEKVRRIQERYRIENYSKSYAYGDSRGDREMLDFVDEGNLNYFK
jgi:HAD superfamily hydrolase (TIGR01490 family)